MAVEKTHLASLCFLWGAIDFAFHWRVRVFGEEADMGFQTVQMYDGP